MVTISFTGFSIQLNILPNINDMGLLLFFVKINRPVIIIIIIIMVYSKLMLESFLVQPVLVGSFLSTYMHNDLSTCSDMFSVQTMVLMSCRMSLITDWCVHRRMIRT
jgi:hypothetical protein